MNVDKKQMIATKISVLSEKILRKIKMKINIKNNETFSILIFFVLLRLLYVIAICISITKPKSWATNIYFLCQTHFSKRVYAQLDFLSTQFWLRWFGESVVFLQSAKLRSNLVAFFSKNFFLKICFPMLIELMG